MALQKFKDAAGREAWLDTATNKVYTEGGTRDTFYTLDAWNQRQLKKYGAPSSSSKTSSSSSKTSTVKVPTAQEYAQAIVDTQNKQIQKEVSFIKDYLSKNPFAFDELLAKQSATAEYEPYYTELLNDYIEDIDVKRATVEDDRRLSEYLSERSAEKTSRDYEQAIASAEEGFAGSGMFFSGIKDRTGGLLGIEKTGELADIATKEDYAQKGYERQLGVLDTSEARQRRDIQREQDTAIAGGIETRRGEAMKQYYTPLTQSYYRQFPTSSGGVMKGYMPESYLMY